MNISPSQPSLLFQLPKLWFSCLLIKRSFAAWKWGKGVGRRGRTCCRSLYSSQFPVRVSALSIFPSLKVVFQESFKRINLAWKEAVISGKRMSWLDVSWRRTGKQLVAFRYTAVLIWLTDVASRSIWSRACYKVTNRRSNNKLRLITSNSHAYKNAKRNCFSVKGRCLLICRN